MTVNMGTLDRAIRFLIGIALIGFALFGPADISWKWIGWFGVIPAVVALVGWCPAYTLFGIKTCRAN
ncbi:DUF2892 domain-containing protein [Pannonibacter sp. Pt2-lr]|jgi:CHASE2 domain-containing sensor protein|uniref:Inner membrane protein YgaP-like transmembrane domain-containing protein n=2 Tax=Pannonibacter TaxID=227873 RepID=A0A0K6I326_9HYPH|nr:DUF2892 domain-containing protein [Pannonibacter indicus]CUA97677.1 Protein of unknown function (DUF2892) [Pannonibacter indicus]